MTERPEASDPEMPDEDKLSVREAAEAISVTRGILQRYITSGRINANPDGTIDAAELHRAGFIIRTLPPRLQSLYAQYQPQAEAESTIIVPGRFRKARVRPLKKYGQYRGRGQLEVGPNVVTIRGKHVYSLGDRWGFGLTLFFGFMILTRGTFAPGLPGFILIYLIVEYWWLKKEDITVLLSSITGVALDETRQLLAIEFATHKGGSTVALKSPEVSSAFRALQSSRSGSNAPPIARPAQNRFVKFDCPQCGTTIYQRVAQCMFCNTPLTDEAIDTAVEAYRARRGSR